MFKKQIIVFIISALMLVVLCGCESVNIKQAKEAYEKGDYATVVELLSKEEKLDDELQEMLDTSQEKLYDEQYSSIQTEINNAEELEKNYFSQYVDMSGLSAAKEKAQTTLENSDKESYAIVLEEIQSQNTSVKEKLDTEASKIYSAPATDGDSKYPFKVDDKDIPERWSFKPLIKQSSKNPEWIITSEAETTDEKDYANLFIDGSSPEYDFKVKNGKTKEIQVQNKDKELEKAVVNTEVSFKMRENYSPDDGSVKVEKGPFYLFTDKDGVINLALKSFDGDDFFILYTPGE